MPPQCSIDWSGGTSSSRCRATWASRWPSRTGRTSGAHVDDRRPAIPPRPFYKASIDEARRLLRFAFCKKLETLEKAAERLGRLGRLKG